MVECITEPYGGELTADAYLILREEAPSTNQEVTREDQRHKLNGAGEDRVHTSVFTMLAHRAVLWPLSEYFASKFKNWSSSDSKPEITILVPAGQLEVGKALITAMYDKLPTDISQQQLLQLLTLAESYRIERVADAVVSRFSSMPVDQLEWETVIAIEQLPDTEPLYQPVIAAAEARRMQLLGDLEVIWALKCKEQQQLMQQQFKPGADAARARGKAAVKAMYGSKLSTYTPSHIRKLEAEAVAAQEAAAAAVRNKLLPHELLLQLSFEQLVWLLSHKKLKVMSENTVHYTITRWLQKNPGATVEQQRQLAQLVRLHRCTPNYLLGSVCSSGGWLPKHFPAADLAHAMAACLGQRHKLQDLNIRSVGRWPLCGFSAGLERPTSALSKLALSWHIPLEQLEFEYEDAVAEIYDEARLSQPCMFQWQGLNFRLSAGMHINGYQPGLGPRDHGYVNAVYVNFEVYGASFDSSITVWKAPESPNSQPEAYVHEEFSADLTPYQQKAYLMMDTLWSESVDVQDHVVMDHTANDWAELEQKLRDLGLVHSDNCLHVTAEVRGVC